MRSTQFLRDAVLFSSACGLAAILFYICMPLLKIGLRLTDLIAQIFFVPSPVVVSMPPHHHVVWN